eukprot:RCo044884
MAKLQMCCVHDKSRRMDALEEIERGYFRCKGDDLCHVGKNDIFDPTICCIHKKKRRTEFLEEIEPGIFRCSSSDPCKVGAGGPGPSLDRRRADGGRWPRQQTQEDGRVPFRSGRRFLGRALPGAAGLSVPGRDANALPGNWGHRGVPRGLRRSRPRSDDGTVRQRWWRRVL